MHKLLIFACCAVSVSFASSNHSNTSESPFIRNETQFNRTLENVIAKVLNKSESFIQKKGNNSNNGFKSRTTEYSYALKTITKQMSITEETADRKHRKVQDPLPFLHKMHARITRSKDAVWATISLTFVCVLLVLSVAQSRMWKDHYHIEAQGIPLPNFNERVLFKDVMEHKMKSFKQFFKKKSKQESITELESLLPPSEWDV